VLGDIEKKQTREREREMSSLIKTTYNMHNNKEEIKGSLVSGVATQPASRIPGKAK